MATTCLFSFQKMTPCTERSKSRFLHISCVCGENNDRCKWTCSVYTAWIKEPMESIWMWDELWTKTCVFITVPPPHGWPGSIVLRGKFEQSHTHLKIWLFCIYVGHTITFIGGRRILMKAETNTIGFQYGWCWISHNNYCPNNGIIRGQIILIFF